MDVGTRLNGGRSEDSEDYVVQSPIYVRVLSEYPDAFEVEVPGYPYSLFWHQIEKAPKKSI